MVNNPLVFYFEKLKDDYGLKTYEDIANCLDISIGTVKNAYSGRTIFPSKRLTKHLNALLIFLMEILFFHYKRFLLFQLKYLNN